MPVLRHKQTKNYTSIPNAVLQDQRLSCRDRGLLVWMLSKPTDWQFSKTAIVDELKQDGEGSIKAGIKSLKAAGYLEIKQERTAGKITRSIWTVTDSPQGCFSPTDSPQGCFLPVENSPNTKYREDKRTAAAPAFEGGGRAPPVWDIDEKTGRLRRKHEV